MDKRVIKELLQKEDPLVLELGAHTGSDTLEFLAEFRDIRIFCFEPDPRCAAKFRSAVNDPRCTLVEAAVAGSDGTAGLRLSSGRPTRPWWGAPWLLKLLGVKPLPDAGGDWEGSSTIKKAVSSCRLYPWLLFEKAAEVKTVRLDTWAAAQGLGAVDFIWADVQGAERDLIEGGRKTLAACRYLYLEYGETSPYPDALGRAETIELLRPLGFEVMPRLSSDGPVGNLLLRNAAAGAVL